MRQRPKLLDSPTISVLLNLALLTAGRVAATPQRCKLEHPLDLVAIVDSAALQEEIQKMIAVIRRFPTHFSMDKDLTRVAVVSFDKAADVRVNWTDQADQLSNLNIYARVSASLLDLGLTEAKEKLFVTARPNAQKVGVVFTDGYLGPINYEKNQAVAEQLRNVGASLYVVYTDAKYFNTYGQVRNHLHKVAGAVSRVHEISDFGDVKEDIFCENGKMVVCQFQQTCRFDNRRICIAHWYRPLDTGRTCDNSRPTATSLQCTAGDCEKICEKWPWQDSPCSNPSNAGKNATVGHQGNAPEPRELYENCPVKFTVCPTGPTSPTTSTMTTTPTKKTTRRTGPGQPRKTTQTIDDSTTASTSSTGSASTERPGLDTWHIVLIGIGALLLLILFVVLVGCLVVRKKKKKEELRRRVHHSPGQHRFDRRGQTGSRTGHSRPPMDGRHGTRSPAYWEASRRRSSAPMDPWPSRGGVGMDKHRPQSPRHSRGVETAAMSSPNIPGAAAAVLASLSARRMSPSAQLARPASPSPAKLSARPISSKQRPSSTITAGTPRTGGSPQSSLPTTSRLSQF